MTITTHIHRLAIASVLAFALLAGPAAAQSTPTSEHNARWPREPASGPLPTVSPVPAQDSGNDWTLVSVAAGPDPDRRGHRHRNRRPHPRPPARRRLTGLDINAGSRNHHATYRAVRLDVRAEPHTRSHRASWRRLPSVQVARS